MNYCNLKLQLILYTTFHTFYFCLIYFFVFVYRYYGKQSLLDWLINAAPAEVSNSREFPKIPLDSHGNSKCMSYSHWNRNRDDFPGIGRNGNSPTKLSSSTSTILLVYTWAPLACLHCQADRLMDRIRLIMTDSRCYDVTKIALIFAQTALSGHSFYDVNVSVTSTGTEMAWNGNNFQTRTEIGTKIEINGNGNYLTEVRGNGSTSCIPAHL